MRLWVIFDGIINVVWSVRCIRSAQKFFTRGGFVTFRAFMV